MSFLQPLIAQGNLNRLYTAITIANFNNLNVTAAYMSKSQAQLTFDGKFVNQIGTATGIVNSPEPFVMGHVVISLIRSQPLAAAWIAQTQSQSILGSITLYPDSSAFPDITLVNTSIEGIDPGAFDGTDPTCKITLVGTYYINAGMWTGNVQGAIGAVVGGLGAVAGQL